MGGVTRLEDRPFSYRRALERIRVLWEAGAVTFTRHAETRMQQRGLTMLDVEHLIRRGGHVTEHSKPGTLWRYKMEGKTIEHKRMSCVVEMNGTLIIITVI